MSIKHCLESEAAELATNDLLMQLKYSSLRDNLNEYRAEHGDTTPEEFVAALRRSDDCIWRDAYQSALMELKHAA